MSAPPMRFFLQTCVRGMASKRRAATDRRLRPSDRFTISRSSDTQGRAGLLSAACSLQSAAQPEEASMPRCLLRSFLALLVLCCAARAETGLPDGAGKEILETACVKCHELSRVTRAGYSARDWRTVLHMMKNEGAQISDGQLETLASYLAEYLPEK